MVISDNSTLYWMQILFGVLSQVVFAVVPSVHESGDGMGLGSWMFEGERLAAFRTFEIALEALVEESLSFSAVQVEHAGAAAARAPSCAARVIVP